MQVMQRAYWGLVLLMLPVAQAYAAFDDDAFEVGAGQSGADLRLALAFVISTLGFLWASWLMVGVYTGWRDGTLDAGAGMFTVLRALFVLAVIGAFIR